MTRGKFEFEAGIVGAICLIFCIGIASEEYRISTLQATIKEQEITIEEQEAVITELKVDETELNPCSLCGGQAKLNPINDSFYIECLSCELRTDYFESKVDLIKYWNGGSK